MARATQFFPNDFIWGTATSSHQVEGGNRGNDWWDWEKRGGSRIFSDQSSGDACNWWDGRAEDDIQLMAELNTTAHRLSLEWSRIQPREGEWDDKALNRYREILKAMRDAGITPMVTLHHFTNPTWFAAKGGWMHPEAPPLFEAYVRKSVSYLVDLVDDWCTINEPSVYAGKSYLLGLWPPGMKNLGVMFRVLQNMIRAHALAYTAIHDIQSRARVGLTKNLIRIEPLTGAWPDRIGANQLDRAYNHMVLDALKTGTFNPPFHRKVEIPEAVNTLDWIGVNYYMREYITFRPGSGDLFGFKIGAHKEENPGPAGWGETDHDAIFDFIEMVDDKFHLPIYITENGIPDAIDARRPAFILGQLQKVWKAAMYNYPVAGYFFRSLVDNFEWEYGYNPQFRFGLYGLDRETGERKKKRSAELYAAIASGNAISSHLANEFAPEVADELYPGEAPA